MLTAITDRPGMFLDSLNNEPVDSLHLPLGEQGAATALFAQFMEQGHPEEGALSAIERAYSDPSPTFGHMMALIAQAAYLDSRVEAIRQTLVEIGGDWLQMQAAATVKAAESSG